MSPDTKRAEVIGLMKYVKLQNLEDGYAVFEIVSDGKVIVCCGNVISLPAAQTKVKVTGIWSNTKRGRQLTQCTVQPILNDPKSIYEFVIRAPQVGKQTASTVAEKLDVDLNTLMNQPDAVNYLTEKTGIRKQYAESIIQYLEANKNKTVLFSTLQSLGVRSAYATTVKLYQQYGDQALYELISSPYRIGRRVGLTFSACDILAKTVGINMRDNPDRILAAVEYVSDMASNNGHCCAPFDAIVSSVRNMLASGNRKTAKDASSGILIANAILSGNTSLIVDRGQIYLRNLYWQEERTAYALRRIIRTGTRAEYNADELCAYAESVCGVKYAEQQRAAFNAFKSGGLCVLTGGPGTGKTTVVKGLLAAYQRLYPNNTIKLCAPTGRASQRMKEATGHEACTIHRLLEYRPFGDSFACKGEADPIDADLIVVDESSMISIDIAELFFSAIRSGTMVLLVGDTDQLPSVGPGNVLADIIRSKAVPVFALTETHRQGAGSPIIINAQLISHGDHRLVKNKDFVIIESDDKAIANAVRNHYVQYHKDGDPFAAQVLTMTKSDITGCNVINKIIQHEVNPKKSGGIRYGETTYYPGDKVMMTRNNYEIGYFNGDVGVIESTSRMEIVVDLNGEKVHVPTSLLEDMSLAYASTIHKSQGSEYDVVIIVLSNTHISMLQRNILYTAITRAKKRVILIASDAAIFRCVNTVDASDRRTFLAERLTERLTTYPSPAQKGVT